MAQLSRPYQFGLLGIVLLAAVWLVLLQGHSSSSSTTSGSSSPTVQTVTTTTNTAAAKGSSGGSKIYKGAAPGVAGLTKDIAKAEGAVKTSQQNAKALEEKSAAASNESTASSSSSSSSSTTTHSATTPAKAVTGTTSAAPSTAKSVTKATHAKTPKPASAKANSSAPANQKAVEAQLAAGKIALILFWDPRGADDNAVHRAVQALNRSHLKIAVNYAGASQVATFGTITRGIQVYGTPTLLIINKKGQTTTLTGLQDGFAIEQAISEARKS